MTEQLPTAVADRIALTGVAVATLGPPGTDAHAEASRRFPNVVLTESFPEAIAHAERHGTFALVAAGYLERDGDDLVDSWVDLHFRWQDSMSLAAVWEQPTKTMCIATNIHQARCLKAVRRIAIHPATAVFAQKYTPHAQVRHVSAKPIAVRWASQGQVDACVGSLDVVTKAPNLLVHEIFRPTMVWCLYQPRERPDSAAHNGCEAKAVSAQ